MNVYISGSGTLTQPHLEEYSGRIAAFYQRRGIRFAAVITGKSPLVYSAVKACAMTGVCFIPADEALPEQRRDIVTRDADVILYDSAELPGNDGWTDLRDVIRQEGSPVVSAVEDCTAAYRIYTSGTTGAPKGIEVSRGNVRSFLRWFCGIPAIAEIRPRSVLDQAMFSFDLSVADLCYSLSTGARLTVIERGLMNDFGGMFRRMGESGAELAVFTPAFAEMCLCDSGFSAALLPELKVIFFCGEVLKPAVAEKLFRRFPGIRLINAYGPTEACCAVTAAEITPDMTGSALPIGDMKHTAGGIHITDNGEIVITGDSVARYTGDISGGFGEYHGERCFYTGDCGFITDGMLYFRHRLDRQVKVMGFRIEPEDIENNLLRIPGVLQAAVTAVRRGSRTVLSAAVRAEGITPGEIRSRLAELVPAYMLPGKIEICDELPMTANGKLKRGACADE